MIDEVVVDDAEQRSTLEKIVENDSAYYQKEPAMAWEGDFLMESQGPLVFVLGKFSDVGLNRGITQDCTGMPFFSVEQVVASLLVPCDADPPDPRAIALAVD